MHVACGGGEERLAGGRQGAERYGFLDGVGDFERQLTGDAGEASGGQRRRDEAIMAH